jgi:hypothetical protein
VDDISIALLTSKKKWSYSPAFRIKQAHAFGKRLFDLLACLQIIR